MLKLDDIWGKKKRFFRQTKTSKPRQNNKKPRSNSCFSETKCCDTAVGVIVFPMSGDFTQQLLLLAVGFIWNMRQTFWQLT